MLYLDESAACEIIGDRKYSPRGQKATVQLLIKRPKQWSILPAYTIDGYIVFTVHHGSITT